MTFSMGTNYPYYFVDREGQVDTRVEGNPFLRYFAGPGIVYTDCHHAAYVSDSVFNNRVFEPGLNFTGKFDLPPQIVDLRPQLRAFPVDALTKDGIPINVATFIPFKISSGQQTVKLGHPFPANQESIQAAVTCGLVDKTEGNNGEQKHEWDGQLVPLLATPIVQDVISHYKMDELCGPDNPRKEIANKIIQRVTEELKPLGLQVIGGGIGNLMPDDAVLDRRLDTWRAKWESKNLEKFGPKEHEYFLEIDRARTETKLIKRLAKVAKDPGEQSNPYVMRLIDTLGEIMRPPRKRQ
jgi:regulator of protease activity HflC (stomatin/prohibitin superfamily)